MRDTGRASDNYILPWLKSVNAIPGDFSASSVTNPLSNIRTIEPLHRQGLFFRGQIRERRLLKLGDAGRNLRLELIDVGQLGDQVPDFSLADELGRLERAKLSCCGNFAFSTLDRTLLT